VQAYAFYYLGSSSGVAFARGAEVQGETDREQGRRKGETGGKQGPNNRRVLPAIGSRWIRIPRPRDRQQQPATAHALQPVWHEQ